MEKGGSQLVDAPSFVDLCTLHQHAMRYYRLWIYACNTVLAIATLIFTLFAVSVFVDPRIKLLSDVELYLPTFIYAYVAIFIQCGVLQAIGCVGALRLHQKLLNIYWTLLVVLMIGDAFVGLVWTVRLDRIKANLKPNLRQRLMDEYEYKTEFTQIWDWVQTSESCCGVEDYTDFLHRNESISHHQWDSEEMDLNPINLSKLPSSCCSYSIVPITPTTVSPTTTPSSTPSRSRSKAGSSRRKSNRTFFYKHPNDSLSSLARVTHSRRKLLNRKWSRPLPDVTQHRISNVQTTTEPPKVVPPFGCFLPSQLLAQHAVAPGTRVYVKVSDFPVEDSAPFMRNHNSSSSSHRFFPIKSSSSSSASTELPQKQNSMSSTSEPEFSSSMGSSSRSESSSESAPQLLILMTLSSDGCGDKVLDWVDNSSDLLLVIGFCIIGFAKLCFVAILKYELKEMIQKIKLLNGEDEGRTAAMNELIGLTSLYERSQDEEEGEGETDGLMASSAGASKSLHGVGDAPNLSANVDNAAGASGRKDSVISTHCLMGNNIGHIRKAGPVTNHVIGVNKGCTHTRLTKQETEIDEDFDSGSALLSPALNCKLEHSSSGGRSLPKNGNNNNTTTVAGLSAGPSSSSPPVVIDTLTKA